VSGLAVDESSSIHSITKFFSNSADANPNNNAVPRELATVDSRARSGHSVNDAKIENNPKSIAALFFSKKDSSSTDANDEEDSTRCDECGNWIAIKDIAEHADYHFAKRLQEEDRRNQDTVLQNRTAVKPKPNTATKKRKKLPDSDDAEKESRRLFFQPRRS
jgi:hypothetical protein